MRLHLIVATLFALIAVAGIRYRRQPIERGHLNRRLGGDNTDRLRPEIVSDDGLDHAFFSVPHSKLVPSTPFAIAEPEYRSQTARQKCGGGKEWRRTKNGEPLPAGKPADRRWVDRRLVAFIGSGFDGNRPHSTGTLPTPP
jgi:hypothetical protein